MNDLSKIIKDEQDTLKILAKNKGIDGKCLKKEIKIKI